MSLRVAIGSTAELSKADAALDVLIVQKWRLKEARAVTDGWTKIGVYVNAGYMRRGLGPNGLSSSGVPFCVHDQPPYLPEGEVHRNTSFPELVAADITDPTYAPAVAAYLLEHDPPRQGGLPDFVFLDDVNRVLHVDGDPIPGYGDAMLAFIQQLAPVLHEHGVAVIPNIGAWHEGTVAPWGDRIAAAADGGMSEHAISFWPKPNPPVVQGWMDTAIRSAQHVGIAGGMFLGVGVGVTPAVRLAATKFRAQAPKAILGLTRDPAYSQPFVT